MLLLQPQPSFLYCYSSLNFESIKLIVDNCVQLKEINMSNKILPIEAIGYFCNNLTTSVVRLSLNNLNALSDDHVNAVIGRCENLLSLDLGSNSLITHTSITSIIEHLKLTLEELDVSNCQKIRLSSLCYLKSMKRLKVLNCQRKKQDQDILKSYMPNLIIDQSERLKIAKPNQVYKAKDGFWKIQCKSVQLKLKHSSSN